MKYSRLVRDYENPDLPITERVPSLARRFSCLADADGIEPWSADEFHTWVLSQGKGTAAWHAGHLILNLSGEGPWESFNAISAISAWNDKDRKLFATWVISWR